MNFVDNKQPKILLYDLEVTPMLGWVYGTYNTNVIKIEQHSYLMCFSYRWLGEKKTYNVSLVDFPARFKKDKTDDYDVVKALHRVLDEADIVIAHNASGFDNKVSTGRFIAHELRPPSPYRTIDTLTIARSKAKFSSNKLDVLGQQLHIGRKTKETHGQLWQDCINGDATAWKKMIKYNNQDVDLLIELYKRLLPYINNHPNLSAITQRDGCPKCGSIRLNSRGQRITNTVVYRRLQCQDCGGWCAERIADRDEFEKPTYVNYT